MRKKLRETDERAVCLVDIVYLCFMLEDHSSEQRLA